MVRAGLCCVALAVALAVPACRIVRHEQAAEPTAPIDLNTASLRRVEQLPGITPSMARRIVDGRPYDDPHDLVERGVLTERELSRIGDLVVVTPRAR